MAKWFILLIIVVGTALIACASDERSEIPLAPDGNPQPSAADHAAMPAPNSAVEPPIAAIEAPEIIVRTDSERYMKGESIVVSIENGSTYEVGFTESCSVNLCFESGNDWICVERECDGPMTVIKPGTSLEILLSAKSFDLGDPVDPTARFKLDYQIVSEAPFHFAHSNEFFIQTSGLNCAHAEQIALEFALSHPDWEGLDPSRATVRWQEEDQNCLVDFAAQGADLIRTDLWSEGYYAVVDARSGQVIESRAYER